MKHNRIFLNDSDERVYIDTYVADFGKNRDAILVIPGGGYSQVCTNREGEPIALNFFAKGYNAFVLNYRVGPNDVYPNQLTDAASAMIYIKEHAQEFKINPERVFAVGFSAGGHLCGSLATMYAYPEMKKAFGEKHEMIKPKGAILAYPVTVACHPTHEGTFNHLLGKPLSEYTEEDINRFSLDRAASKESSPMFIWHTVEDKLVPIQGSLKLALALTEKGVPYRLSAYPYGPHGTALATAFTDDGGAGVVQPIAAAWTDEADEWMKTL